VEAREKPLRAELEAFKEQLAAEVEQRRQAGNQTVRISELEAQNASLSNKVWGGRDGVMLVSVAVTAALVVVVVVMSSLSYYYYYYYYY